MWDRGEGDGGKLTAHGGVVEHCTRSVSIVAEQHTLYPSSTATDNAESGSHPTGCSPLQRTVLLTIVEPLGERPASVARPIPAWKYKASLAADTMALFEMSRVSSTNVSSDTTKLLSAVIALLSRYKERMLLIPANAP